MKFAAKGKNNRRFTHTLNANQRPPTRHLEVDPHKQGQVSNLVNTPAGTPGKSKDSQILNQSMNSIFFFNNSSYIKGGPQDYCAAFTLLAQINSSNIPPLASDKDNLKYQPLCSLSPITTSDLSTIPTMSHNHMTLPNVDDLQEIPFFVVPCVSHSIDKNVNQSNDYILCDSFDLDIPSSLPLIIHNETVPLTSNAHVKLTAPTLAINHEPSSHLSLHKPIHTPQSPLSDSQTSVLSGCSNGTGEQPSTLSCLCIYDTISASPTPGLAGGGINGASVNVHYTSEWKGLPGDDTKSMRSSPYHHRRNDTWDGSVQ